MDQVETERNQKTRSGILDVELHSQRRSTVTDESLGDAIDANRIVSQHVLRQADDCAGEEAGNGISSCHGKENCDQQRQVYVNGEAGKSQRDEGLNEQR